MVRRRRNIRNGVLPSEVSSAEKPVSVTLYSDTWRMVIRSLKYQLENDDELDDVMKDRLETKIQIVEQKYSDSISESYGDS